MFTAFDSKESFSSIANMENSRKVLNCWKSLDSSSHLGVEGGGVLNHEMLTKFSLHPNFTKYEPELYHNSNVPKIEYSKW